MQRSALCAEVAKVEFSNEHRLPESRRRQLSSRMGRRINSPTALRAPFAVLRYFRLNGSPHHNLMIIAVLNQKGGVGKTTLSVNLAAAIAMSGARPLLIDADPQASALDWQASRSGENLFPVLGLAKPTLHKDLPEFGTQFDYVIIDGPPRVNELARSALLAADLALIPVQPSPYDVWAADEIMKLIQEVLIYRDNLRSQFVINRKIANTAIGRDVVDALKTYSVPTARSMIHQRVVFAESAAAGLSVLEFEPKGAAAREMRNLVDELLQ